MQRELKPLSELRIAEVKCDFGRWHGLAYNGVTRESNWLMANSGLWIVLVLSFMTR